MTIQSLHINRHSNRLTALKGGRIIYGILNDIVPTHPLIAPANTEYPFCVYRRTNLRANSTKDLIHTITISYEIIIVAKTYENAVDLSQAVWEKMEGTRGEIGGIDVDEIRITNSIEDFANDAYLQRLTVEVDVTTI